MTNPAGNTPDQGSVDVPGADEDEDLPPFELPERFKAAEGKESIADRDYMKDHAARTWGL